MSLNRNLIVFDFETDGLNVEQGTDNITQIASVTVDLRTLEVDEDSWFEVWVCPDELSEKTKDDYYKAHSEALNLHAQWRECEVDDYLNLLLEKGITEKDAVTEFTKHCSNYKTNKLPAPGGQNIIGFDLPILEMLCKKHKKRYPFGRVDFFDAKVLNAMWLMFAKKPPKNYSMKSIRPYFGISEQNAHDAKQDVIDTAEIICRYLRLHKKMIPNVGVLYNGVGN